MYTTTMTKT